MLIRCEKCSTLYELDEKLLPPQGAPVQCSKCQFVFKAYPGAAAPPETARAGDQPPQGPEEPPRRMGDDLVREGGTLANGADGFTYARPPAGTSTPQRPPGASPARPQGPPPGAGPGAPGAPDVSGAPPPATGDEVPRYTADGRPIRKVPFPSAEPPTSAPRAPSVPSPSSSRAARGAPALARWVVVAVVVVAIVIVAALAWRAFHRGSARSGAAREAHGRAVSLGGTPEPPPRK